MSKSLKCMKWFVIPMLVLLLVAGGCKKSSSTEPTNTDNSDIPSNPTTTTPPPTTINNVIPSATFTRMPGNENRIQINLLGIVNPSTGQTISFSTSNLFVVEDGVLKGIKITQVGGGVTLSADVVFTVDNSGSMSEEADSIASKITAFCNYLTQSGLNIKVGCVGYDYGPDGALNLTDPATLLAYLNREDMTGTSRTYGFSGADSAALDNAASAFYNSGENGTTAIRFADSLFSWRTGANRIYVNFTDESVQTYASYGYHFSIDDFVGKWNATKGTVHSVFSIDSYYYPDTSQDTYNGYAWTVGQNERPWTLSHVTGGSIKIIHADGTDLDLTQLPVTGALASSYLIEFLTSNPNTAHTLQIIVKVTGADGKVTYANLTYN